jgi:hypothetical protein
LPNDAGVPTATRAVLSNPQLPNDDLVREQLTPSTEIAIKMRTLTSSGSK